nr:DUF2235 domain-containing protein [uncultured Massilia sp.]
MTATLCPPVEESFEFATEFEAIFAKNERKKIEDLSRQRESVVVGNPTQACRTNLFFGFFFDGTKNNYELAEKTRDHSNVARLYDCYPGQGVPDVLPKTADWDEKKFANFFRVYVPGVASPFKQVHDSGQGFEQSLGASAGRQGQARIIWALIQAVNNVHRYFLNSPLVRQSEIDSHINRICLDKISRLMMKKGPAPDGKYSLSLLNTPSPMVALQVFGLMLNKLQCALALHRPDHKTGRIAKIEPAIVKTIYISIFGFSRGASEARAFLNWLRSLCELDARIAGKEGEMSLGGFRVEFDFLGLFDTVASVGLASTTGNFNGHRAWADTEDSLRVPNGVKCLHLIAAHEPRRSFPVDSVSVNGILPATCMEIIVPGAHSDVGGGYCPCEQGKGLDAGGGDMLSRIPLIMMYKEARVNGVPFKLELASVATKEKFSVQKRTITAFNSYLASCRLKEGPMHLLMRENMRKMIEWRFFRRLSGRNSIENSSCFVRTSNFFKNDLSSSAREFEEEIAEFNTWVKRKGAVFKPSPQGPGFRHGHEGEWEEIATWWDKLIEPTPDVQQFFDDYVHDSRASFKLSPIDNEKAMHGYLQQLVRLKRQSNPVLIGKSDFKSPGNLMSADERRAVAEYERTGKIPHMYVGWREPWKTSFGLHFRAGYLRFRKVYAGSDSEFLS